MRYEAPSIEYRVSLQAFMSMLPPVGSPSGIGLSPIWRSPPSDENGPATNVVDRGGA